MLEINIKCHERLILGQNFWIKSTIFTEYVVYDHGLSPLLMQNPYLKLFLFSFFWHKSFIFYPISKRFAAHFTTNKWLNSFKKIFCLII